MMKTDLLKKTHCLAMLAALLMASLAVGNAAPDAMTGGWYLNYAGLSFEYDLREDGSFTAATGDGQWTLENDTLTLTAAAENGAQETYTLQYDAENEVFAAELKDVVTVRLVFSRQPQKLDIGLKDRTDAAQADYQGHWETVAVYTLGLRMDPAESGLHLTLDVADDKVTWADSADAGSDHTVVYDGAYARVTLLPITEFNPDFEVSAELALLENGQLRVDEDLLGMRITYVLEKRAAE